MKNIIIIFVFTCSSYIAPEKTPDKDYSIIGRWCLITNEINYPSLTFGNDSIAIFDSKMDTLYSFKYYVNGDNLNLFQPNGDTNEYRILKLTKDSLRFGTLLEHKVEQIYYRCK